MVVRRVRADEVEAYRALRLTALADAPDAFATTYVEAAALDINAWAERARRLSEGLDSVMFVADDEGHLAGMAGAFIDPEDAFRPHLISMWVAPEARRRGVGVALVGAVVGWARELGFASVRLFVIRSNEGAAALYARSGFQFTGHTFPMPRKPELLELEMRLDLG